MTAQGPTGEEDISRGHFVALLLETIVVQFFLFFFSTLLSGV